jgi:hypothetical protein
MTEPCNESEETQEVGHDNSDEDLSAGDAKAAEDGDES